MLQIFIIILPLFLIIFGSALVQKSGKIDDNWPRVLNAYALRIGLPVLIFKALAGTKLHFGEAAEIIVTNSVFLIAVFLVTYLIGKLLRFKKENLRTIFICMAFGNIAYLGIPVTTEVYGEAVLPQTSLLVAIYLFWMFTVGIGYLDYTLNLRKRDIFKNVLIKLIKNPLLIAVLLGILISSFNIKIPATLAKSIDMLSASVTPTVLVVIGLFIGQMKIGKIKEWIPVLIFSVLTLMVMPLMLLGGIKLLDLNITNFIPSIMAAAMPMAITPFALAEEYKLNQLFIARSIVLSTILSVISLPFWISTI